MAEQENAIEYIRNFSIIAHIDHGKSTLADRLLQITKTVADRDLQPQMMDTMDLERERGITIKLNTARMSYTAKNGQTYVLNMVDTPGHVDFTYEVSRSLAACEGVLLVVDASQGIEAQTLANAYMAFNHNLAIIPVVNKIDLPAAEPERVMGEIENIFGIPKEECILASAKEGQGVPEILEAIVERIPPPMGESHSPLRALIFDSFYDDYRGVVTDVRLFDGQVKSGDKILMMGTQAEMEVIEVGYFRPKLEKATVLKSGEVGYIIAGIKNISYARVGDTVTLATCPAVEPLPGYKEAKPMVFCGFYPIDTEQFSDLKDALEKLKLNDAALHYEPETSQALGFGFRCGFLGLLHMNIIQERVSREYNIEVLATAPSVVYQVYLTDGSQLRVDNPAFMPKADRIDHIDEPVIKAQIILPKDYMGAIMTLVSERRGKMENMEYIDTERVMLTFLLPLCELVTDFFDMMKSMSKGYASLDYEYHGYQTSQMVKLEVLLAEEIVDALSFIVHKDKAYHYGRELTKKLKELIPRQQFEIPIQAAIGAKVVAHETISAIRKNVIAKCYGGDISRKRKLLEKQKEGKKKMKQFGNVEVPQEAFMAVLKLNG